MSLGQKSLGTPVTLSPEFKMVLDMMENTSDHLFITGKAGTGKSTLLTLFRKTTRKKVVVLAPTGLAALNVKGQTIHSFFGFPPKYIEAKDIYRRKNRGLYKKVEVIVIDEISMVRADMMDNINTFLQKNRDNRDPFGGVQMIFFGDMYQLPPIVSTDFERMIFTTKYESQYFFSSAIIESIHLEILELNKVYRQDEKRFVRLLDGIRTAQFDYDDLEDLNQRSDEELESDDFYITLSPRNAVVNKINSQKLSEIDLPGFGYSAKINGEFNPKLFPTNHQLELKEGAQVMFLKNDPEKQFVNGSIGKIVGLNYETITVEIEENDGSLKRVNVTKTDWEIIKYQYDEAKNSLESKTTGVFTQYPLKLAWAITIHKSQGQTFDKVILDMGQGAFEYGQTYVALSRCKSMDGLILKQKIRPRDIMVDIRITDFYQNHR